MEDDRKWPSDIKQDISLLFLDVDGVLNTNNRDILHKDKAILSLDRSMVERLKLVLTSTNIECKICISSAWRLNKYSLQYLKKRLLAMADIDIEHVIIGTTPSFDRYEYESSSQQRVAEIKHYLSNDNSLNSKYNIISFCVIDDLDLRAIGQDHFVHIDPKYGLNDSNVHSIVSILNQLPLNHDDSKQKLLTLKSRPKMKLLFIAASKTDYHNVNISRLQIISKKTECQLVIQEDKYSHDIYDHALTMTIKDKFVNILQYITDLESKYNIVSWAVLDFMQLYQHSFYTQQQSLITRRFIKVSPSDGLVLNDVLAAVSILNKWSY